MAFEDSVFVAVLPENVGKKTSKMEMWDVRDGRREEEMGRGWFLDVFGAK